MTTNRAQPTSKTQRKREMHALQVLGEELVTLPDSQLAQIPLPGRLREAVLDARKMTKRGALARQRQYIGRLMREIDAEPVREAVEKIRARERSQHMIFHQAERWRDRIIDEGDEAIEQLIQAYPDADRQQLRSLLLKSRRERDGDRLPAAARALFKYVRELMT